MYKPSLIKTNARYRGQTESYKFVNMVQEIAHDLGFLYKKTINDSDEEISHKQVIKSNMKYIICGEEDGTLKNTTDTTKLSTIEGEKELTYQKISPSQSEEPSIKNRLDRLDSQIKFLVNNL